MPEVQLLPSPRVNPYARENTQAFMSMMNILASTEVARRKKIMTENVLQALAGGGGREGISQAALAEPGFSGGIPGLLQRIASPFAAGTTGLDDIIAGKGIESAFAATSPSQMMAGERWNRYQQAKAGGDTQTADRLLSSALVNFNVPLSPEDQVILNKLKMDKATGRAGPGFGPGDKKALAENMDRRIKSIDKWHPGWKDFTEKEIFNEWKKLIAQTTFLNDNQRENTWATWKEKANELGGELDWNPADPKWREAIGLKAETQTGSQANIRRATMADIDKYPEPTLQQFKNTFSLIRDPTLQQHYYDKWKHLFSDEYE